MNEYQKLAQKRLYFRLAILFMALTIGLIFAFRDKYGFELLCTSVGGIWCYWPGPAVKVLVVLVIILIAAFFFRLPYRRGKKTSRKV